MLKFGYVQYTTNSEIKSINYSSLTFPSCAQVCNFLL